MVLTWLSVFDLMRFGVWDWEF